MKNDSDSIQFTESNWLNHLNSKLSKLYVYNIHAYIFSMIINSPKLMTFYNHAKKVVVAKIPTTDCINLAVLPI